jgi:hypothetical protein
MGQSLEDIWDTSSLLLWFFRDIQGLLWNTSLPLLQHVHYICDQLIWSFWGHILENTVGLVGHLWGISKNTGRIVPGHSGHIHRTVREQPLETSQLFPVHFPGGPTTLVGLTCYKTGNPMERFLKSRFSHLTPFWDTSGSHSEDVWVTCKTLPIHDSETLGIVH